MVEFGTRVSLREATTIKLWRFVLNDPTDSSRHLSRGMGELVLGNDQLFRPPTITYTTQVTPIFPSVWLSTLKIDHHDRDEPRNWLSCLGECANCQNGFGVCTLIR